MVTVTGLPFRSQAFRYLLGNTSSRFISRSFRYIAGGRAPGALLAAGADLVARLARNVVEFLAQRLRDLGVHFRRAQEAHQNADQRRRKDARAVLRIAGHGVRPFKSPQSLSCAIAASTPVATATVAPAARSASLQPCCSKVTWLRALLSSSDDQHVGRAARGT